MLLELVLHLDVAIKQVLLDRVALLVRPALLGADLLLGRGAPEFELEDRHVSNSHFGILLEGSLWLGGRHLLDLLGFLWRCLGGLAVLSSRLGLQILNLLLC